jgi:hypothetical protein
MGEDHIGIMLRELRVGTVVLKPKANFKQALSF